MIEIKNKSQCCGCASCQSICPKNCIHMKADEEGFLYPNVDKEQCVNCGLCEQVCPIISGFKTYPIIKSVAVRHLDSETLSGSTSGGAFSAIGQYALNQNGVVYGCAYNDAMEIVHISTDDDVCLADFRGSKYVQSNITGIYNAIKQNLIEGRFVVFSGTSCQVAGLNNYLKKSYENLLTVEVICHGTPSPYLWEQYLNYQKSIYKSNPKSISFRKKTYGYHSGTMEIVFENGKRYTGSARVDLMLKSFFSEIASRPSCYACPCKGMERAADLSIYDCWSASKIIDGLDDDDKGYTNILINPEKGQRVLEYCVANKYLWCAEVDTEKAISFDGIMICNYPHKHPMRGKFYKTVREKGIKGAVDEHIPVTRKDYIIENSKHLIYQVGLIKIARKVKGWIGK